MLSQAPHSDSVEKMLCTVVQLPDVPKLVKEKKSIQFMFSFVIFPMPHVDKTAENELV